MIIPNKNYSLENTKSVECSCMQCEKKHFTISSSPEYANDLSTIGESADSVQTENDCWLSRIGYEKNHSKPLSCTEGIKNRYLKEQKLSKDFRDEFITDSLENDEFSQQNFDDLQNREYFYDISDGKPENECNVEKQNNNNTIPEDVGIGKNMNKNHGVMIVNYHFTKNSKMQASNKKERSPHIIKNKNKHFNTKTNTPTNKLHNEEYKYPKLHSQVPEKNINDNESSTFSMMNEKDINLGKHFPNHLQTNYVPEEFRTSFDNFLESNFPFNCKDISQQQNLGCSNKCIGMKMSMENDHITRTQNISMCYPHICYMEPKFCDMSCQGIPRRKQRSRIPQSESKHFSEIEISNSCCYSNLNPHHPNRVMEFNEECCRRNLPQFQDDLLKLRHLECCSCNKSHIVETHNEKLNGQPTNSKKKKHFTCCKSGKVDQEELSSNLKPQVKKEEILEFLQCRCCPSNVTHKPTPYQEQVAPTPFLNQKICSDTHFKCGKDCPFKSEKEYHLRNATPKPMTKSIGCECTEKYPENKIDSGRNITIQIIPNYGPTNESCKHENTPILECSNVEQRIIHPPNNCCKNTTLQNQNNFCNKLSYQQIRCQPYPQFRSSPLACNDLDHYPRYAQRGRLFRWWSCNCCGWKPYRRNRNLAEMRDCCTTTCQDSYETKAGDCEMVAQCQRVLPINNTYVNRDAVLLRSLHRLNRGLLQDIFATPCPSSSACHNSCLSKLKRPPYPLCAGLNPLCYLTKPPTSNQCSQYDPDCKEKTSSKDVLFECLKYLKNSGPNENDCEYFDEDCCCCCQSYHKCCCCERTSRCCERRWRCCEKEIVKPKLEEKTPCSCSTRCRSVEAKQSLRNCGTVISNMCFKKTETVCTNTETRVKTPKPEMRRRRICCRRRCCCCNRTRNCCCCCDRCCNSDPTTCYKKIQKTSCCNDEHMIYYCQCEAPPIFYYENVGSGDITQPSSQKCIKSETEIKDTVSKGIDKQSVKEDTIVKFYDKSNTTEKSTNTITSVNSPSQLKDVLIKSLTLNLCDLGEKRFSKFGVSSQQYPWSEKSFFVDMPHEIYRFIGIEKFDNPLSEKVHDPTPCLKPEILHDIELVKNHNEVKEQNEGEDTEKVFEVKKRCLSTICKAFFDNQQKESNINHNIFLITKERPNLIENFESCNYVNLKNKIDNNEKLNKEELNNQPSNEVEQQKKVKETQKFNEVKVLSDIKKNNKTHLFKSTSKTSQSIPSVASNISKKSSNIPKVSCSISSTNYTPKPFTTKTGLMSFIPSFRESYKTTSPVKKNQRPSTKMDIKSKISKTQYKSKDDKNKKIKTNADEFCNEENINVKSILQQNEKNGEKIELGNTEETLSTDLKILGSNENNDSTVPLQREEENRACEETKKQDIIEHEPFNSKKFNEEINAFYEKCFKISKTSTAKNIIPFYNTSVSDVVKSLESRCSVHSTQMNTQKSNEVKPENIFPNEDCKNISFPNKSNSEFYSEVFQRSYDQNNMRIPNKIMSKTDLINLN